jgi:membrane fusion protein (multidrug efflux system)
MAKKLLSTLAILMLVAISTLQLGCVGADDANAATGDDAKAEDAKQARVDQDDDSKEGEDTSEDGENSDDKGEDEEDKEEAVPVEIAVLDRGPIESVLRFSSNLEAESQVQVFSQAKRLITERLVEEGDIVKRGELLIRLQDDEQRSALDKVKSQLAKAEREYRQQQRLFEQDLISETVYNDATYELDQLKISIQDAERELSYTEVRAPISGTVTSRMVNLGDQVQIGQHLFDIVDFDSIVARIFVPEKHLDQLRRGLTARIGTAVSDQDHIARVERIAPIVDPKSGTVKVTVAIGGQPGLRPGMYVDVNLVTATHDSAVLVPKRAVIYDNSQMFVFRMDEESRVERVFIEAELTDKENIEPTDSLQVGDQIVVAGQAGLKDGSLVSLPGQKNEASTDTEDDGEIVERASR